MHEGQRQVVVATNKVKGGQGGSAADLGVRRLEPDAHLGVHLRHALQQLAETHAFPLARRNGARPPFLRKALGKRIGGSPCPSLCSLCPLRPLCTLPPVMVRVDVLA